MGVNDRDMKNFLHCIVYLALLGFGSFLAGRILPAKWFRYESYPYKAFAFEKNGKIYESIGIRYWKDRVPDMSKIFPNLMPSKKLAVKKTAQELEIMLVETCVAELIHTLLCVFGFGCVFLWKGAGGVVLSILFLLGNIPFNLIQRYNRPKLLKIWKALKKRESYR